MKKHADRHLVNNLNGDDVIGYIHSYGYTQDWALKSFLEFRSNYKKYIKHISPIENSDEYEYRVHKYGKLRIEIDRNSVEVVIFGCMSFELLLNKIGYLLLDEVYKDKLERVNINEKSLMLISILDKNVTRLVVSKFLDDLNVMFSIRNSIMHPKVYSIHDAEKYVGKNNLKSDYRNMSNYVSSYVDAYLFLLDLIKDSRFSAIDLKKNIKLIKIKKIAQQGDAPESRT